MTFFKWFREQSHRDDAVGWAAKWFLHKGQGRYPKRDKLKTCDEWLKIVEAKASKAHQLAARSAFVTAWNEFHSGLQVDGSVEEIPEGDVMHVRSTVARLRKVVKGSHESGEVEEEEELAVGVFKGPVATVGLRQRLTTSYGGDWIQLGVMLSVPCYVEEIDETFDFADEWVTNKIQSEVDKFRGGTPPQQPVGSSDGAHTEETDQADEEEIASIGEAPLDPVPEADEEEENGGKETYTLESSTPEPKPKPKPKKDEDFGL